MGRWFGSFELASYFYALSFASWFEVGVHWGSQYMVNREAAARFDELNMRLPGLFAASLLTILFVVLLVAGIRGPALAIIAGCALTRAASTLLGAISIGRGHITPPAVARILSSLTGLGGLLLLVRPEPTLARLAVVIAAATIAYVAPLVICSHRLGVHLITGPRLWPAIWRQLAGRLWPFLLLFFCGQLLYRVDISVLEWMGGSASLVAHYGLAFKWIEGLFFLPYVVASAAIPVLVRTSRDQSLAAAHRTLLRIAAALLAGAFTVTLGLLFVGEPLLLWLMGSNFAGSVPLYRLFAWLLPIHSLGVFFAAALVANGLERRLLVITAMAAVLGLAIKVPGFLLQGVDLFSIGVFAGLILHTIGCAVVLWRHAPAGDPA